MRHAIIWIEILAKNFFLPNILPLTPQVFGAYAMSIRSLALIITGLWPLLSCQPPPATFELEDSSYQETHRLHHQIEDADEKLSFGILKDSSRVLFLAPHEDLVQIAPNYLSKAKDERVRKTGSKESNDVAGSHVADTQDIKNSKENNNLDPDVVYPIMCSFTEVDGDGEDILNDCQPIFYHGGVAQPLSQKMILNTRAYAYQRSNKLFQGTEHLSYLKIGLLTGWVSWFGFSTLTLANTDFKSFGSKAHTPLILSVSALVALIIATVEYHKYADHLRDEALNDLWLDRAGIPAPKMRLASPYGNPQLYYKSLLRKAPKAKKHNLSHTRLEKVALSMAREYNEAIILYGDAEETDKKTDQEEQMIEEICLMPANNSLAENEYSKKNCRLLSNYLNE